MTRTDLKEKTKKQLETLAKKYRILGWHSMRKDELIDSLANTFRNRKRADARRKSRTTSSKRGRPASKVSRRNGRADRNGHAKSNGQTAAKRRKAASKSPHAVNRRKPCRILATAKTNGQSNGTVCDRLGARVCNPHWIHATWTLTPRILQRAEAAMGIEWHESIPVIRVFDVTSEDGAASPNSHLQDIEIQGEVDNWYVPAPNPPRTYELQLGYLAPSGHFFMLVRSPKINTPRPGSIAATKNDWHNGSHNGGKADGNGATPFHFHRSLNGHSGNGTNGSTFPFAINAELIVHGSTHPNAQLTLLGEPVPLAKDGSFSLRLTLPDGRQVIPAVAITPDGAEQRTIVLGVERNTKELEPKSLEESAL